MRHRNPYTFTPSSKPAAILNCYPVSFHLNCQGPWLGCFCYILTELTPAQMQNFGSNMRAPAYFRSFTSGVFDLM